MTVLFEVRSTKGATYAIDFDGRTYTVLEEWQKPVKAAVVDGEFVPATTERAWRPVKKAYWSRFETAVSRLLEIGLEQDDHRSVATLAWQMGAWKAQLEAAVRALSSGTE